MNRFAVFALLIAWSWFAMTLLHELGHILVGCSCGGTLTSVELRPWCLPYSFFAPNPRPLLTLWAGPILGSVAPLCIALLAKRPSFWFVAWFCVVANGLYLLLGCYSGDAELDSVKMIKAGMPAAVLVVVSLGMAMTGYIGFRKECQRVLAGELVFSRRVFATSSVCFVIAIAAQCIIGVAVK